MTLLVSMLLIGERGGFALSPPMFEMLSGMYVLSRIAVLAVNALDVTMDVSLALSLLSPG